MIEKKEDKNKNGGDAVFWVIFRSNPKVLISNPKVLISNPEVVPADANVKKIGGYTVLTEILIRNPEVVPADANVKNKKKKLNVS